jgi:hypothetical protein
MTGRLHNSFGLVLLILAIAAGRFALSGSWDRTAKLWDVAAGQEIRTFVGSAGAATYIAGASLRANCQNIWRAAFPRRQSRCVEPNLLQI